MESDAIEKILESVAAGKTTPAEALLSLKKEPFTDLGYAKVDHHRALRQTPPRLSMAKGKPLIRFAALRNLCSRAAQRRCLLPA